MGRPDRAGTATHMRGFDPVLVETRGRRGAKNESGSGGDYDGADIADTATSNGLRAETANEIHHENRAGSGSAVGGVSGIRGRRVDRVETDQVGPSDNAETGAFRSKGSWNSARALPVEAVTLTQKPKSWSSASRATYSSWRSRGIGPRA